MRRSLWVKFLLLLVAVALVGLSAAFVLRGLMIRDFREYREGEMEDRAYWLIASLEGSYAREQGWLREDLIEGAVWALMMGMEVRLYDGEGKLLMDTGEALESLSPIVRKRVLAFSRSFSPGKEGGYVPYGLFLRGERIGGFDARFLSPGREALFISRSRTYLWMSLVALGGSAIVLSVVFARRMGRPIRELTSAASSIAEGRLESTVAIEREDELGELSETFNRMARALATHEMLKRRLTANIAHELRTPISAMRGELEGMMDGLIPVEKETLRSLYQEVGRLRSIIEGIEDLSQAEASSLTLQKRPVELGPFVENIVGRFRKLFLDKQVSLEVDCEKGLLVHADPDKLSQVLINLLSNALKATGGGGSVTVSGQEAEGRVLISVADTGSGIGPKDLPFVFERFYRASEGGLGLGLTITKELVEAHGGSIGVRSAPGKGSEFTVSLPK